MIVIDDQKQLEKLEYMQLGVLEGYRIFVTTSPVLTPFDRGYIETNVFWINEIGCEHPSYLLYYGHKGFSFIKQKNDKTPLEDKRFVRKIYDHFIRDIVRKFYPDCKLDEKLLFPTPG